MEPAAPPAEAATAPVDAAGAVPASVAAPVPSTVTDDVILSELHARFLKQRIELQCANCRRVRTCGWCSCVTCRKSREVWWQQDVAYEPRVVCVPCQQIFCADCIASCVEVGAHRKDHPYRVVDNMARPLLAPDWTAEEEVRLLQGIDMFGLGNWGDIAQHVGGKHTDKRVKDHYVDVYLHSATQPLPDVARASFSAPLEAPAGPTNAAGSAARLSGALSVSADTPLVGYMPLRGDFEVEHDNDAEELLAGMEFEEGEHKTETALKLKVIEIYNARLDERIRRKDFAIAAGLLDFEKQQALDRKRPREEREVYQMLRPFARFQTPEQHDALVQGVVQEQALRKHIEKLQEYRRNGIRSLPEAEEFENAKKNREAMKRKERQRDSHSYLYESGRDTAASRAERTRQRANKKPTPAQIIEGDATALATPSPGAPVPVPEFKIEEAPDVDKLEPAEVTLCAALSLFPRHYLSIKQAIVSQAVEQGVVQLAGVGQAVNVCATKANKVYDFCVSCGWVDATTPTTEPTRAR